MEQSITDPPLKDDSIDENEIVNLSNDFDDVLQGNLQNEASYCQPCVFRHWTEWGHAQSG